MKNHRYIKINSFSGINRSVIQLIIKPTKKANEKHAPEFNNFRDPRIKESFVFLTDIKTSCLCESGENDDSFKLLLNAMIMDIGVTLVSSRCALNCLSSILLLRESRGVFLLKGKN